MARRWTINGRFLTQPVTGVQRYALEIVREFASLIAEQHPLARDLELEILTPPGARAHKDLLDIASRSVGRVGGHIWEQTVLPSCLEGGGLLSLCNTGPLATHKQIVCIHDANTWNAPQSYSLSFRALYRLLLPTLGRTAWKIATVSNYSQSQLANHGIAQNGRTFLAPNGHEHALRWRRLHSETTRAAASRRTIVLIGSTASHKNTGLIMGLAERLAGEGMKIAVIGQTDPRVFSSGTQHTDASNVTWLGRVSDEQLAALLQDSLCLAFPSLTEGFGLPVLEAMAIGCPAVVSDRASLPEVGGNAVLYAAPDDGDAWFDCFVRLKSSPQLRLNLMLSGKARARDFMWRQSAVAYLSAMAEADGFNAEERNHRMAVFS